MTGSRSAFASGLALSSAGEGLLLSPNTISRGGSLRDRSITTREPAASVFSPVIAGGGAFKNTGPDYLTKQTMAAASRPIQRASVNSARDAGTHERSGMIGNAIVFSHPHKIRFL